MNRRSFLKAFGTLGVSVVVAQRYVDMVSEANSAEFGCYYDALKATTDHTIKYAMITGLAVIGAEDQSRHGVLSVKRLGGPVSGAVLLQHSINTAGGIFRWVPAPGAELVTLDDYRITVEADFDGAAYMTVRPSDAFTQVHVFALSRERGATAANVYPLEVRKS